MFAGEAGGDRRAAEASASHAVDLIVATDMLDLTTFLALTRTRTAGVPVLLYAHENQWTYPLPTDPGTGPMRRQKGERDRHYAWVNVSSMLAADRITFTAGIVEITLQYMLVELATWQAAAGDEQTLRFIVFDAEFIEPKWGHRRRFAFSLDRGLLGAKDKLIAHTA